MKYYVLKCSVESTDLNEENYGILMVDSDNNREYSCNISDNANEISFLVDRMNGYNVELHQAKEIIEDLKFNIKNTVHI